MPSRTTYAHPALTAARTAVRSFGARAASSAVIAHESSGDHCHFSGQQPGEDLAVASWLPISKGLTPHGFRRGHKVWMDKDQIADVLKSERLGHEEPGMRGVYGHVSQSMRDELEAAWEPGGRRRYTSAQR